MPSLPNYNWDDVLSGLESNSNIQNIPEVTVTAPKQEKDNSKLISWGVSIVVFILVSNWVRKRLKRLFK